MAIVKVGLIGCGRVAQEIHLPALRLLPEAEVTAIADVDAQRLQTVADRFDIKHRHGDFHAVLNDPEIEAVAVCVPAEFHAAIALHALEAGKHLFVEKPLALGLDDADRLVERAAQSPQHAMVGFNMRWHPLVRRARDLIASGALGRIEAVRTAFTAGTRYRQDLPAWRSRRELGGSVLAEVAPHHFDLWRFLLGTEVEQVFAVSRSDQGCAQAVEEVAAVTARLSSGAVAVGIFADRTADSNEVEIYGRSGRLRLSCYQFDGFDFSPIFVSPGALRPRLRNIARTLQELPGAMLQLRRGGSYAASYRAEWAHFIGCIQTSRPVECTLEDGRRALQVTLAALASSASGQPVQVAEAPREIMPLQTMPQPREIEKRGEDE